MKPLTPEEMEEFRTDIAAIDVLDDQRNLLINYLDAIAASFIHQALQQSSIHLSLSARANFAFTGAETHANLPKSDVSELVDLGSEGAINTIGPKRQLAP